ncbi:MAG: hypothetical protein HOP29_16840, partial [Phycisphaerales bacterium]|nr:hypothetical protein [Phycisphaerales bacterium]
MNALGRAIVAGVDHRFGRLHRESVASILAFVLVLLCATDRLAAQFMQSELVVRRCIIRGSSAAEGGGVFATGATVMIENSVMVGNTATDGAGGAVHAEDASVIVRNATVAENEASGGSGGVWHSGSGTVNVDNCILWRNAIGGGPLSATAQIDGNGISVDYSCVQDEVSSDVYGGIGNIDTDPLFTQAPNPGANGWGDSDDQFGRLTLGAESPCLDAGDESLVVTGETDLAGGGRVWRDSVDMGAYEAGRVVYVDADADAGGNGYSWETAFDDLQDAMEVSQVGTEIWVAEGTYIPTEPTDPPPSPDPRSVSFSLPDGASVYGGFRGVEHRRSQRNIDHHRTILCGDVQGDDDAPGGDTSDNAYTVVTAISLTAPTTIDGFDVVGGHGGSAGGGVRTESSNLLIDNCRIVDNSANDGGGIHASGAGPLLTVRRCTLLRNQAMSCAGGGIHNTGAASIEQTFFHGNSAVEAGGGVYTDAAVEVNIENSVFVGNQSPASGAVHHASTELLTVTNCTIAANVATQSTSTNVSGGVYSDEAELIVTNVVLWGNTTVVPRTLQAQQIDGPPDIDVTYSCVQDDDPDDFLFFLRPGELATDVYTENRHFDPRFVVVPDAGTTGWGDGDDEYGNVRLRGHSEYIDFGNALVALHSTSDIGGAPRWYNRDLLGQTACDPESAGPEELAAIDAGAFEAPGSLCAVPYEIWQTITDGGAFSRYNLQMNQVFGPGDYPPRASDAVRGSSPLVSKESTYFEGPTPRPERPLQNDVLDLITGRPLIQETDFELPFGGAVFRHIRTYGESVADHGVGETNQYGAFWDWNGLNWMMSENPILLVDGHFPFINYEGTATSDAYQAPRCYFIPDAHHSIPFIFDKSLGEYTAPPWFDAVLQHNGSFNTTTFEWTTRPTQFYAWLQHGAVRYTFDVDLSEPAEQVVEYSTLTHTPFCELEARDVTFTDIDLGDPPNYEVTEYFDPGQWCNDPQHLFEESLQNNADILGSLDKSLQAGIPYLAYVTRISDRYGNAVEYEYCPPTGADACNLIGTNQDTCTLCSNCGERGQINAIRLRAAPEGNGPGEVVWTLAYTHRSLPSVDLNPILEGRKHPHHLLHSIHVYEGDVDVSEGCRTVEASYFDPSVSGGAAQMLAAIDAVDATNAASSGVYPPLPKDWRYRAQYMYNDPQAGSAFEHAVSLAEPNLVYGFLVKVDVSERTSGADGQTNHSHRLYRYERNAGTPPILSNRYTLSRVYEPQTIDMIVKGLRLATPEAEFGVNDLIGAADSDEIPYLDPERLDCACCAESTIPSLCNCSTCGDAVLEQEFGGLADLTIQERPSGSFVSNNLVIPARYASRISAPSGKRFWIAQSGKSRLIDRRKGRVEGGAYVIYNGFIASEEKSPNLVPDEVPVALSESWLEPIRPTLFHWPYRYWWFDQDVTPESARAGEYVEPQRGEVFWVTIIERESSPDGFEGKLVSDGLGGSVPVLPENTRTRIVEMDVAGFVLRDRSWSVSGGVTQEGFAESFVHDIQGRVVEHRSKGVDVAGDPASDGLITVFTYATGTDCEPDVTLEGAGELRAIGIKRGIGGPTDPVYYTKRFERCIVGRPELITREVEFPVPVTDPDSMAGNVTEYVYEFAPISVEHPEPPVIQRTVLSPPAPFDADNLDTEAVVVTATDEKGNICCAGMGTRDGIGGPFLEFYFDVNEYDDKGRPTKQIVDANDPGMCPEDFDFQRVSQSPALNLTTENFYDSVFGLIRTTRRDNLGALLSESRIQYIEDKAAGALEQWIYKDVERTGTGYLYHSPVQITRFEMGKIAWTKQVHLTATTLPPHTHNDYEPITAATPTYDATGRISGVARSQDAGGDVTAAGTTYSSVSYASSGQISRQKEAGGTITRHVYDKRGRLLRTYRGTMDDHEVWGTSAPGGGDAGDNLVLVEKRYYGAGASNADMLIEIRHYRDKPANQYFMVAPQGEPQPPANNEDGLGWLERFEYDWRMRAVRTQTDDGSGNPIRHTLTWYDNLDRVRFTAEYGVAAPAAGSAADPRALGEASLLPDAGDILSNAVKPLSLTETIHNGRGLVEETRVYDVSDADGDTYTWTRNYYNHVGKPIETIASNGPSQRFTYDAKGRQTRRASHVNGVELSKSETVYDFNDNPTVVTTRTRKHDASGVTLVDSNSVKTWHFSWYDEGKRLIATADYGTNEESYQNESPPVEPAYNPNDTPAVYSSNDDLTGCYGIAGDPRTTCYEYDAGGRVKTVINPGGAMTRTEYDALGRVLLTLENFHENAETPGNPIRRTAYRYDGKGRLADIAAVLPNPATNEGVDTYAEINWSQGPLQVTELEYDATVIDSGGAAVSGNADWVSTVRFPDRLTGLPGAENVLNFTYTVDGQAATRTDGNGTTLTYTYDEVGRLRTIDAEPGPEVDNDGSQVDFSYNDFGLGMAQNCGPDYPFFCYINTFDYDARGNLRSESQYHPLSGGSTRVVEYAYDSVIDFRRLTSITYPDRLNSDPPTILTYSYGTTPGDVDDILGRVTQISHNVHGPLAQYNYTGGGMRVGTTLGNGVSQSVAGGNG